MNRRDETQPPALEGGDHIRVSVPDRPAAVRWFRDILDVHLRSRLEVWADGGPLMLQNPAGTVTFALFEREPFVARTDPFGNGFEVTTYENPA